MSNDVAEVVGEIMRRAKTGEKAEGAEGDNDKAAVSQILDESELLWQRRKQLREQQTLLQCERYFRAVQVVDNNTTLYTE